MAFNCDTLLGETSKMRFIVLAAPTETRPADFAATALELPELTTTDMPVSISTKTKDTPRMYGCPPAGAEGALRWAKPLPDQGSWTVSLSGNVQPTEPERAAMETLFNAAGKYVWVERRMNSETAWEGGCALVTATGAPVPADGIVTFSATLTGYGALLRNLA